MDVGVRQPPAIPAHLMAGLTVIGCVLFAGLALIAPNPVTVTVRPQLALAPVTLTIQAHVLRHAENRYLRLASTDETYVTVIQLDGDQAETVFTRFWTVQDEGDYEVEARVLSATGQRGLDRARVTIR